MIWVAFSSIMPFVQADYSQDEQRWYQEILDQCHWPWEKHGRNFLFRHAHSASNELDEKYNVLLENAEWYEGKFQIIVAYFEEKLSLWHDGDVSLSEIGIEQCRKVNENIATILKNREVDIIVISPLKRARETAQRILSWTDFSFEQEELEDSGSISKKWKNIHISPNVREKDYGDNGIGQYSWKIRKYLRENKASFQEWLNLQPCNKILKQKILHIIHTESEKGKSVQSRIIQELTWKKSLTFTHSGTIRQAVMRVIWDVHKKTLKLFPPSNASMTIFWESREGLSLVGYDLIAE